MAGEKIGLMEAKLERKILGGLSAEWEVALWVLSSSHRAMMKKPLFSLKEMKGKLGYWSEDRREICLCRSFVREYPWEAVREVLLHEVAHQFTSEVLRAAGESAHGPAFREACGLLRANPKGSFAYRSLEERLKRETLASEDRIMVKVKKLMALAESGNRHEAEAAMAKAHGLIAKYNVDLLSADKKRNFISVFLGEPALRHFRETYHLASLLTDYYFVTGLWVSAWVLPKEKMGRVLEISGTPRNVEIASYVHDFVNHFIDIKWKTYNRDKGLTRYRKTDFAVGIIEGFREKLKSQGENRSTSAVERSVIKVGDPKLDAYMAHRHPRISSFRRSPSTIDATVHQDGRKIGKKMVISKGVSEQKTGRTALIGS